MIEFYTFRELLRIDKGGWFSRTESIACPNCNYGLDYATHEPSQNQVWLSCPHHDDCEFAKSGGRIATESELDEETDVQKEE